MDSDLGQARSQDLEKGGGGYFERVRSVQTTLTRISFRRFVRKLRRNFSESSEIQRFFPPKIRLWRVRRERAPIAVNRLDCAALYEQA